MDNLVWNDGMSVGVEAIDNDHKKILSLIAKIITATDGKLTDETLEDIFSDLEHYVQFHFQREEELMESVGYPDLERHKKSHQEFIEKVPELKAQLLTNTSFDVVEKINLFLHHWIIDHILIADMDYAQIAYHQRQDKNSATKQSFLQQFSQWLSRHVSLTKRIFISALIPISGMFILSFIILKNNWQQYDNMQVLLDEINPVISQVNSLTHSLQIERGLSSGFISSNYQNYFSQLQQRREITDKEINTFFKQLEQHAELLLQHNSSRQYKLFNIEQLKTDLSSLIKQRVKIDNQQINILQLKSSYTQFISHLLSIQQDLTHIDMSSQLANNIMAINAILNLKEIIAQGRALGTIIIEQANADINNINAFNSLHDQQHYILQTFYHTASEEQKHIYGSFTVKELIDDFTQQMNNHLKTGKKFSTNGQQWFDKISLKIDKLKIISDQLTRHLKDQTEQQLSFFLNRYYLVLFILTAVIVISTLILLILDHSIINPIRRITEALKQITSGNKKLHIYEQFADDEIAAIYRAYEKLRRKLLQGDISEDIIRQQNKSIELRKHTQQHYKELASTDSLTGALNRRSFYEIIRTEINHSLLDDRKLSIMMLDIDRFKKINDKYGHAVGDQVLISFYNTCSKAVRASDIIARIGGEEFVILMPQTNLQQAGIFAERLREMVEKSPVELETSDIAEASDEPAQKVSLTVSIGVSQWDNNFYIDKADFLEKTDKALYTAKQSGRNRVVINPLN